MIEPVKILVFGTFDILHEGHLNLFTQARALAANPRLIVSIALDDNVHRIKGKKPTRTETERQKLVGECPLVDKVVLGAPEDYINHIVQIKPDIIALGYDQQAYTEDLAEKLAEVGFTPKIIRLKPFKPEIYKTSIIKDLKNS